MIFTLWNLSENARMVVCTVHEPKNPPADRIDRAEAVVFVKDGFSLSAALLAPVWLAMRRMWLVLAGYIAVLAVVVGGMSLLGFADQWITLAVLAIGLIVGFESDSLRRWTLERSGATTIATVAGKNFAECERRFFDSWLPTQPIVRVGSKRDITSEPVQAHSIQPAMAMGGPAGAPSVSDEQKGGWLRRLLWR